MADGNLSTLLQFAREVEDLGSTSLFQYAKRTMINSRVFIDNILSNEECMSPLMTTLMNLYTGLVFTALDINKQISETRRVRDLMSIVSTEELDLQPIYTTDALDKFFLGSNSKFLSDDTKTKLTNRAVIPSQEDSTATEIGEMTREYIRDTDDLSVNNHAEGHKNISMKDTTYTSLPSGRVMEVQFSNGMNKFSCSLYLQFLPRFIPTEVMSQFVSLNFTPSFRQRWLQASAGEISMIGDLLLGNDIRKKKMQAQVRDKTGALKEMMDRQSNALSNYWLKLAKITPERQNIANTILIFEKRTLDKACSNAGLKFTNFSSRQRFFDKTFSMIVVAVDTMYNKCNMYFHGIDGVSNWTFSQLEKNQKDDKVDLQSVMKAYAQGMAPRY